MKIAGSGTFVKLFFCCITLVAGIFCGTKIVKAEAPIADHLLINELCTKSSCQGGEWIEIFNPTDMSVDLSVYTLEDNLHKQTNLSGQVEAGGYLVLYFSGLNDDGDCAILRNEDDEIVDQVFYGKYVDSTINNDISQNAEAPGAGESISRLVNTPVTGISNIDFVIATPTFEVEYIPPKEVEENLEPIDITIARQEENGEGAIVIGAVTVLPGTLSSQYFYIQDETGGIQIYCYYKTFPSLSIGDEILVKGELSETNNERRVKIGKAEDIVIQNHTDPIAPAEVAISEINESDEGTLVKTVGIVTETSGDTFTISDSQRAIKVVIKESTNISKPKMKKGDEVEVTGIVSQYKNEYRILPIDQDDVKIISTEEELPRAGNDEFIYFIPSFISIILWNTYHIAKKKLMP